MSTTYELAEKYLVAMFSDGTFLYLEETPATTTPLRVKTPMEATKKRPYISEKDFFTNIRESSYYFEDSPRMRSWLEGSNMVVIKEKRIAEKESKND